MSIGDTDFGVQVGIGFVGRVLTTVVAFLGSVVLARALGPGGYGAFYLLMGVVMLLDNPVTGWATACRKRLTEVDFPSDEAIGSMILVIVASSSIALVVAWLGSPLVTEYAGHPDAWLYLAVLYVGVSTFASSLAVLKATAQFGSSTWVEAGRDVVRVLVQVALVLAGYGVGGMVGGMVVGNILLALITIYLIGARPTIPSGESLADIWQFAKSSIPAGFVGAAQHRMDILLLGFLIGTEAVGNYEIALKMTMPAMFVAGVAQNGLMGRISNLRSRNEPFAEDIQNNLAYASVIAIPLFFATLIVARPVVVTLYSSQFAAAAPFLIGLALFRLLRTQKAILKSTINGLDRPDKNLRISTIVFIINVSLGVALLSVIGPLGVVVATVLSEVLAYGSRAYVVKSAVPSVSLLPRQLFEQLASGFTMLLVVYVVRQALPLATWPYVAVIVGLGGVTYFGVLVALSHSFRATVLAVADDAGLS